MKEPIRGYLRRRIEKIERPKSLFGKVSYTNEQSVVAQSTDVLYGVVTVYRPEITLKIENPLRRILPKTIRENKIRKGVMTAYKNLKQILP